MATPVSGAISMNDMRSEVTRGTGSVSMSQIRAMIQGGTGSISFSNCRGLKGFPNAPMTYQAANKYVPEIDGLNIAGAGNTYYQIQSGVNSYLYFLVNNPATSANSSGVFTYANGNIIVNSTTFGENQLTNAYYNGVSCTIRHDYYAESPTADYFQCTGMAMANTGTANVVLRFSG